MSNVSAFFCHELDELMVESGRIFKVPPQIARTVNPHNPDPRFVKSWAVIHRLIPADSEVLVLVAA